MNSEGLMIYKDIMKNWAPPPKLTISEWADRYRYLSRESSPEPGKWDTSKFEYQRGVMDAISDPEIEVVVMMFAAQMGKTEIINNAVGYYIDQEPSPILVVQPTLRPMAEEWSKNRFAPMIRDTPVLKDKVKDAKIKDSSNTILHKKFPGGSINISGANSPASLAAMPRRIIILDETDRYPPSAGSEGDPVALAEKRAARFWNRKIIKASTPTIKGESRIEKDYELSDKRKYFIPCPKCGHYQELKWSNIIWMKDNQGNHLPETAVYICSNCKHHIDDVERWDAINKGEWRPTAKPQNKKIAGFHIWAAYVPGLTLMEIVQEWLEKHHDPEQLKTFVNTVLAETYEEKLFKIEDESIYSLREKYKAKCPMGVLLLTCFIDVQKDRLEGEIKGWGIGQECWGIEYFILYGQTDQDDVWNELAIKLQTKYEHESGLKLKISITGIDSGYRDDYVHKFVKRWQHKLRVFATKGKQQAGRPIISRPSKTKYGTPLFVLGTDALKERVLSRLEMTLKNPYDETDEVKSGIMHFPLEYDQEYFKQLTAEKPRTVYKKGFPHREWVKNPGDRNEVFDITVGNFAMLEILNPNFEKLKESLKSYLIPKEKEVKKKKIKRISTTNNWVNGWKR